MLCGQLGINRENDHWRHVQQIVHLLLDQNAGCLDILLSSHENEDVPRRQINVRLDCLFDCSLQIVIHWHLRKLYLHREGPSWDLENSHAAEELRKLLRVHSRGGHNYLHIPPLLGDILQNPKKHISIQRSLMRFIHNNGGVLLEHCIVQALPQQNPIGHVLNNGALRSAILEPDGITNLFTEFHIHLLTHSLGYSHSSHSSGLRAPYDSVLAVSLLV